MGRLRLERAMESLTQEQVENAARAMPDHVLSTAFLEPQARPRLIALILFSGEISRARAVVSESGLAAIRLQWWRDRLDQIYAGLPMGGNPIAIALAAAIKEAGLPRVYLDAMIDGYERELRSAPFQTWSDLEAYLDATSGNLNRLSLLASGLPALSVRADAIARDVGVAWGLAHLMGRLHQWSIRRSVWIPEEARGAVDLETLFARQSSRELSLALDLAMDRLSSARRSANRGLGAAALGIHFPVLAHACLSRRIAKASLSLQGGDHQISLLERQIRITLSVARGRI